MRGYSPYQRHDYESVDEKILAMPPQKKKKNRARMCKNILFNYIYFYTFRKITAYLFELELR